MTLQGYILSLDTNKHPFPSIVYHRLDLSHQRNAITYFCNSVAISLFCQSTLAIVTKHSSHRSKSKQEH